MQLAESKELVKWVTLAVVIITIAAGCARFEQIVGDTGAEEETAEGAETEQPETEEVSELKQPGWYTEIRPYRFDGEQLLTAGSSVSVDSARAARQAREMAGNRLLNGFSRILEDVRETVTDRTDRPVEAEAFVQLRYNLSSEELQNLAGVSKDTTRIDEESGNYQAYVAFAVDRSRVEQYLGQIMQDSELYWVADEFNLNELIGIRFDDMEETAEEETAE